MATIGDIHLTGELKKMRESIRPGSRDMLAPAQGFGLSKVKTPQDAVKHLVVDAIRVVRDMPERDVNPDHPAIGALATVLKNPDADASLLRFLDEGRRAKVEEAVRARDAEWSPAKLEWNWTLLVAAHPEIPLHPGIPLAEHVFEPEEVGTAWLALVDLEVLWAWGLVS
jgi:hypothetical protein